MPRTYPTQIIALIDQNFPDLRSSRLTVSHTTAAALTTITRLVEELPDELLTISGEDYSSLVGGLESIKNSVAFWHQKGVGEIGNSGFHGKNALFLIREGLVKCPDQAPSRETAELLFITDADLRDSIRLDISTATSALHNGEWKAATVLAGAAAEALLLWAITNSPDLSTLPNKPNRAPEFWELSDYILVATALNLIKAETGQQATLARNFRNLIHPGRAQRLGEVCDKGTALTALAAVELIVRDLT